MKIFFPTLLLTYFFLFLSSFFGLHALTYEEISPMMNKVFEFHVDQKHLTPEILRRSLKIYIETLDPYHIFFLQDEVYSYLHPTPEMLNTLLTDYRGANFKTYQELDTLFKKGYERCSLIQSNLSQKETQPTVPPLSTPLSKSIEFAKTPDELQYNIANHFALFLRYYAADSQKVIGNQDKLSQQYQKVLSLMYSKQIPKNNASTAEKVDHHALRILRSLAKSLDTHTTFFSPEEANSIRMQLESELHGIGVVLQESLEGISILRIVQGGPADKCGLVNPGDRILAIDGQPIENLSLQEIMQKLRGNQGSAVSLRLLRGDETNIAQSNSPANASQITAPIVEVQLKRDRITLDEQRVTTSFVRYENGIIGTIRLDTFYEGKDGLASDKDILNAIQELREIAPLRGLVLDLRSNSGGFLSQAIKVSGLFITNGVVALSRYSDGTVRPLRVLDSQAHYNGPLIVLASRASASAAEIVAQALQDYGRCIVVGDPETYGKGTIQHQTVTDRNATVYFKVTVGRYYTVSGNSTQITGVKSDITVPSPWYHEQIGERYLEYPLPADSVASAYYDTLSDIPPHQRPWFFQYYLPRLQQKSSQYKLLLPLLTKRSQERMEKNKTYQLFLKNPAIANDEEIANEEFDMLIEGEQLNEAIHIMEDMIHLSSRSAAPQKTTLSFAK